MLIEQNSEIGLPHKFSLAKDRNESSMNMNAMLFIIYQCYAFLFDVIRLNVFLSRVVVF